MTGQLSTDLVWSQLSSDLRRFIRRRVADDHTADDLLQETFLRIHRNLSALHESERLAAWVYQIARNVIHDHFRKRSDAAVPLAEEPPVAEDRTGHRCGCAGEWFDELIQQLPETYRDAVRSSEIDELPQQAVADRMGLSLSGAKSRIQRGRVMLKQLLDQCCAFHFDRRGNLIDADPKPDRTVCRNCEESTDPSSMCS